MIIIVKTFVTFVYHNFSLSFFCHGSQWCCVFEDTDGLISQALLVGNFEGAVDLCLNDGRYAEAILLSISGGEELLKKTQQKYLSKQKNSISMVSVFKSLQFRWNYDRIYFSYANIICPSHSLYHQS